MAELSDEVGEVIPAPATLELSGGSNGAVLAANPMPLPPLTVSGSFKEGKSSSRRRPVRPSLDADDFLNLLHGSDPVKVELNRLENEVRGENVVGSGGFLGIRSSNFGCWFEFRISFFFIFCLCECR